MFGKKKKRPPHSRTGYDRTKNAKRALTDSLVGTNYRRKLKADLDRLMKPRK